MYPSALFNDSDVVANFEALATPETIDGGAGTDILNFGAAVGYTLDATDMHNIKNIEVIQTYIIFKVIV